MHFPGQAKFNKDDFGDTLDGGPASQDNAQNVAPDNHPQQYVQAQPQQQFMNNGMQGAPMGNMNMYGMQ